MDKEQQSQINLLLATFRCFNEQLHGLQGEHSKQSKYFFNRLLKVSKIYEREVIKMVGEDIEKHEALYDALMDVVHQVSENQTKKEDKDG